MRVNVYGHDLTRRVEAERKTPPSSTAEYIGIQFFVGKDYQHTPGDDDTSAVAFWYHNEYERGELQAALEAALKLVKENKTEG